MSADRYGQQDTFYVRREMDAGIEVRQVTGRLIVNGSDVCVHVDRGDKTITVTDNVHYSSFLAGLRAARTMAATSPSVAVRGILHTVEFTEDLPYDGGAVLVDDCGGKRHARIWRLCPIHQAFDMLKQLAGGGS